MDMQRCLMVAVVAETLTLAAWAEEPRSSRVSSDVRPETLRENVLPSRVTPEWELRPLTAGLAEDEIDEFDLGALTVEETAAAVERFHRRNAEIWPGPARLGTVRDLPETLTASDLSAVAAVSDGRKVAVMRLRAEAAFGVRVHFRGVDLKDGQLIVYADGEVGLVSRGPFRGRGPGDDGEFWTGSLPGETVVVEYAGSQTPEFEIDALVYLDRAAFMDDQSNVAGGARSCNLDATCENTGALDIAYRATGRMSFISDGSASSCTGTLLADADPATNMPYFITADHCIDSQSVLNTLEVVWFYQTATCDVESSVPDYFSLPRLYGDRLLATSGATVGNDAMFCRLRGALFNGMGFAGTNTDEEAGYIGFSHPRGDWKRATYAHYVSLSTDCGPDCGCFTPANYGFYKINGSNDGIIEPGSSGSGMFDSAGRLIGQLFGHCSLCPDTPDCFHTNDWCLMYGEWEQTREDVAYWLLLGGSIHVDDSNTSPPWDGTSVNPFFLVNMGYGTARGFRSEGVRLVIHAGSYPEVLTIDTPVDLVSSGGLVTIGQ
jgi:hypothetical protein